MTEAYSVAIKLSLVNSVSSGLLAISKNLQSTHMDATRLEEKLKSIGKQAALGGLMFGGGMALAGMFKAPLDAAKAYELAFTKFKTINLGDNINKQADAFARSANVLGVSSKELMESLSESVGLFGNFDLAKKLTPKIAALNAANSAIFQGKVGHIDEGSTRALLKFIDRRGGTHDEATFMRNLDLAQRMVTGSGGFVKFRDLDQFSQMGGTSFRSLSDQGILNMSLLLQEQGGAKAGTAMMSMYQNLVAGRTPKKTMALLQEFGLGHLAMETHATVGGKAMKSLVMRDIKDSSLLQSDPATWIRNTFLPALAAKGITSEAGILKATNDLLSNRTASNQASIMSTQVLQLMRDSNLAKNAMGTDKTMEVYKNDPNSKFADLQAKWNGLLVNLGISILPMAIKALEKVTPLVGQFATYINQNKDGVKQFALGLAGVSTFLVAGGLANMIVAAGRGFGLMFTLLKGGGGVTGAVLSGVAYIGNLLMLGLRAIPVVGWVFMLVGIGVYLYRNWDTVKARAKEVWGFISPYITGTWDYISNAAKEMWGGIKSGMKSFVGFFLDQWQWLFNSLISGMNTVLPKGYQIGKMHFADDWNRNDASYSNEGRGHVPVPPRQPVILHAEVPVHVGNDKVAHHVVKVIARAANAPATGSPTVDRMMSVLGPSAPSLSFR
ncbi:hypothetical protein [Aquitalea aquatica]|uniref:Phage tail tape measure protein n=1 Tax=Aquitalea aquatica TaxID=3044273 RepID=A0A838YJ08_9NEIS|nr:hypothetical protein [Aquitalea magnusonii]MBA4710561.1 hypothetical protein [Aquitalea magnusonii]